MCSSAEVPFDFLCWGHLRWPLTKYHMKLTAYRHRFGFQVVILDLFCISPIFSSRGHREGAQWVEVEWGVSPSQGTLLEGKFRALPKYYLPLLPEHLLQSFSVQSPKDSTTIWPLLFYISISVSVSLFDNNSWIITYKPKNTMCIQEGLHVWRRPWHSSALCRFFFTLCHTNKTVKWTASFY